MKTISLSEAKATLSEQLRHVRAGGSVVITHRGRPIARLVPEPAEPGGEAFDDLVAAGLVRRGSGRVPPDFWSRPRPTDPAATVRLAIDEERESGW